MSNFKALKQKAKIDAEMKTRDQEMAGLDT
jgi:hypothetical protein